MDESAQQAVSISVNITIFVVALSVTLSLIFGVRDIADVAAEIDQNSPDGSMILATGDTDSRIISGYEVISYYYNYIKPYFKSEDGDNEYNHKNVGVIINTGSEVLKKEFNEGNIENVTTENDNLDYDTLKEKINLNANYTLTVKEHYNNTNDISGTTMIVIEQIPELVKGDIYTYYVSEVKPLFRDPDTNNLYDSCGLRIIMRYSGKEESFAVNVNSDAENNDEKVKAIIDKLTSTKQYSVRVKKENVKKNMTSSSISIYIDQI